MYFYLQTPTHKQIRSKYKCYHELFKDAGDVDRTFFWPIIIQRTKVFLEAYAIPSQKTHRKMGVHVLVSMVTEQIY